MFRVAAATQLSYAVYPFTHLFYMRICLLPLSLVVPVGTCSGCGTEVKPSLLMTRFLGFDLDATVGNGDCFEAPLAEASRFWVNPVRAFWSI